MKRELYTIGHSTHSVDKFIELLAMHTISAVCDVRSDPYSKHVPQFDREPIEEALHKHGIAYVFLGRELGAKSSDPECYVDGKVQFDRLARTEAFQHGLDRLRQGMEAYRIALMCADKDPLTCHRAILICRRLRSEDLEIKHILEDGGVETQGDMEKRLLRLLKIPPENLFESMEQLIERAYEIQSQKIAASEGHASPGSPSPGTGGSQ